MPTSTSQFKSIATALVASLLSGLLLIAGGGATVDAAGKNPAVSVTVAEAHAPAAVTQAVTKPAGVSTMPAVGLKPRSVSGSSWWGTTTWYSRGEVRQYASWYGVINITSWACNAFGWLGSRAVSACKATVGAYTGWIVNTFNYAKANNQCVEMKMLWTGQVIGMKAYACNWG